ncbi:hypothetical protein [Hartmannibacter diazotrophicus]|uniref:hypothetical protein n=1 Tax=Hartmannibacter diazotrophicus TaxID=1482074 RepID=UPI000C150B37|nr:hypothetical protein [Hartmannibacter diazotrophicus]
MVNDLPISERDLIHPTITIIAEYGDPDEGLSISELAPFLRDILRPSRDDLSALRNRSDDRLSQKIRNLVSHRTLERRGFAIYRRTPDAPDGRYILTDLGWDTALSNI